MEPLKQTLDSTIESLNEYVTGSVKLKVYKGSLIVQGRWSEFSSYSPKVIDYDKGWYPTGEEASGFIKIYGFHSLAASKARKP
jgi:argininosuccinate synthase